MISTRNKILIFLLSFLSGVFLAPDFIYIKDKVYILILVSVLFIFLLKSSFLNFLPIALTGILLGFVLFFTNLNNVESKRVDYADDSEAVVSGFVASYPQEKEKSVTFVLNSELQKIYVLLPKIDSYQYGQKIKLSGKINKIENEDDFNFKDYFLSKKISYQMFYPKIEVLEGNDGNIIIGFLSKVRQLFENKTNEIFVKPYSSFVLGILLGIKSLSGDLMDMFSKVSLSHIIVVSGYNLSIIAEALKKVFYPTSRRLSFWIPISGIWFFTFLVGADAPVLRAAVMASVIIFSRKDGKKSDGLAVLTLAAVLMVLFNPLVLRYDPGFQLSFLSTLGIMLYGEKIEHFVRLPKVISEVISATLAAQVFILPIIAFYFGRISVLGPIANFIVLPIVPIIMFTSFITVVVGFINLSLACILSSLSIFLILFCLKVGYFLSDLKFASINVDFNVYLVVMYFTFLISLNLLLKNVKKKNT